MEFIETHCHLDDDAFDRDLPEVLESARAMGVRHFVNIGYDPRSWERSRALARRYPDVSFTLGMHPNSAELWSTETRQQLVDLIGMARPVAIGEIGLDFFREHADHDAQRQAFRDQLELAEQSSLPVVIHMRGDVEHEIMAALSDFPDVAAIAHSFDGSAKLRDVLLQRGDSIGVGGLMTRAGSAELRDVLRSVPLDAIVLETDSPYLVPRGVKSRRNAPTSIPAIAMALAELLERPLEEIARQTTENARRMLKLPVARIDIEAA